MSNILFKEYSFKYDAQTKATLKNINLAIKKGEKVLIAGPSGSGKSTLGHCLNGLIPFSYHGQSEGCVEVAGKNLHKTSLHETSKYVGTILQDQDGQFVGLSVGEDVGFYYENHCIDKTSMHTGVKDALEAVQLLDYIGETPHNLSGGQKQSVSLAGILTTQTDVLLFDEPLANLDPLSAKEALSLIDRIHKENKNTVIIIEHRIEDVIRSGVDRIIVMDKGHIIADATPDELLATSSMTGVGLREPLYVEALKSFGITIEASDTISQINHINRYKKQVTDWYQRGQVCPKEKKDPILSIKDINFKYYSDGPAVLENVSFDIGAGEILGILGNNGAGKSTLLKLLTGIEKQHQGTFYLEGKDIKKWSIKKRSQKIGYVMQNPNHMITKVDIFDEVAFGLVNQGVGKKEIEERVNHVLKVCGLYKFRNWPVSALSYGQKKRVTIASILVMNPKIVVLDEPTAGQDYKNYKEFMTFICRLRNQGISIVIITHDMQLALEYADRAVVLSAGQVIKEGTVPEIMADKAVMKRANLRSTTLSDLSHLVEGAEEAEFLSRYCHFIKEEKGDFLDE